MKIQMQRKKKYLDKSSTNIFSDKIHTSPQSSSINLQKTSDRKNHLQSNQGFQFANIPLYPSQNKSSNIQRKFTSVTDKNPYLKRPTGNISIQTQPSNTVEIMRANWTDKNQEQNRLSQQQRKKDNINQQNISSNIQSQEDLNKQKSLQKKQGQQEKTPTISSGQGEIIQRDVGFEFEDLSWTVMSLQSGRSSLRNPNNFFKTRRRTSPLTDQKTDEEEAAESHGTGTNLYKMNLITTI